jgi:EAL domain-containing protein (putative c-di-GMP-specific phosphodiesterase class I)
VLHETGCPSSALELEITESFMMQQPEEAIIVLQQLCQLGIELAIDDFGTGHSSLSYLKRFPIHRLKIDRSFIRDMGHDADDHIIVKTIIALGHSLNLKITAEGVETKEQHQTLVKLEGDEAQGYLLSRPVPAEEFCQFLKPRSCR